MKSDKLLEEKSDKLDLIARLLIVDIIKDQEPKEQVRLLDQAGLKPKEISRVIHKTPNAVRLLLFSVRHQPKTRKTGKSKMK